MLIHPNSEYTIEDLLFWFKQAREKNEVLVIDPCNPNDPKLLQTIATIRTPDDIAVLTQWLGGLKSERA